MKATEFTGIIPPLLSSFTREGEIYEKGLREIVRFTLPHVNGYYPIGTYGCGPLMTLDERKRVLEIILDEVNGKVPIIAHVGTADTRSTVELAIHAKKAGAAAVGAIAPYYSPGLPEDYLYEHYAALLDAVNDDDFPVFVYNNGHYSQNPITPRLLKRLADRGLRGCKDSSFDLVNFMLFQEAVKDYADFNVIIGTEAILIPAFDLGAVGCVCGLGNIYPEILAALYRQYQTGDRQAALQTQRQVVQIRQKTKLASTVPIMHEILRLRGVDAGYPRLPYGDLDEGAKALVREEFGGLGLI